jgi:hypothetical protein
MNVGLTLFGGGQYLAWLVILLFGAVIISAFVEPTENIE